MTLSILTNDLVQKWISRSLVSLNEEDSLRRFKEHDLDEDGKLGWEEYLKSFYGEFTWNCKNTHKFLVCVVKLLLILALYL